MPLAAFCALGIPSATFLPLISMDAPSSFACVNLFCSRGQFRPTRDAVRRAD